MAFDMKGCSNNWDHMGHGGGNSDVLSASNTLRIGRFQAPDLGEEDRKNKGRELKS
jgi:hypothetical protein